MNDLKGFVSNKQALSVRRQCELLEINRSFVYYQPVKETEENLEIMQQMDREFLDHPTHGVLQMQDFLLTQGFTANRKIICLVLPEMMQCWRMFWM